MINKRIIELFCEQTQREVQPLYHISNEKFSAFDSNMTAQSINWFATDKDHLISDRHGAGLRPNTPIYLYTVSANVKKTAGWDEYDKLSIMELESQGFDSVALDDDFIVFDDKKLTILKRELLKTDVDEAYVNNNPLDAEAFDVRDTDDSIYDKVVDLDTELKIGIREDARIIFIDILYTDAYSSETNVIGDMKLSEDDSCPYPIVNLIKLHPSYQGKGYGKTIYEWIIDAYGGIVSDSSLSKQSGRGSFYVWRSLERDGYKMSVVKWSDITDYNSWEPKKIKSIDSWVKHGKETYRLVAEG